MHLRMPFRFSILPPSAPLTLRAVRAPRAVQSPLMRAAWATLARKRRPSGVRAALERALDGKRSPMRIDNA